MRQTAHGFYLPAKISQSIREITRTLYYLRYALFMNFGTFIVLSRYPFNFKKK